MNRFSIFKQLCGRRFFCLLSSRTLVIFLSYTARPGAATMFAIQIFHLLLFLRKDYTDTLNSHCGGINWQEKQSIKRWNVPLSKLQESFIQIQTTTDR